MIHRFSAVVCTQKDALIRGAHSSACCALLRHDVLCHAVPCPVVCRFLLPMPVSWLMLCSSTLSPTYTA